MHSCSLPSAAMPACGSNGTAPPRRLAAHAPRARPAALSSLTPASAARWNLYSCRMPLIGLEGLASVLEGSPGAQLVNMHTYILLQAPDKSGVWLLDFLPINPTAPSTGLMLLTCGSAPGEVRVRKLGVQQVNITDKVRLLGSISHPDPLAQVQAYNRAYDKELHLLLNNCMHYTNGLSRRLLSDQ